MWGPCSIVSPSRFRYFVDDYSQTTSLYLMKNRSKLFSHFHAFCVEIHTQFHVSVQNLRSDDAKEYISEQFQAFMLQKGILHQTSCVETPSQNGVAERKNRHFLNRPGSIISNARAQAFLGWCCFYRFFFY